MFRINRLASIGIFVLSLTVAAFSQAVPAKSVLINTTAFFDEKAGIAKLIAAEKQLDGEFAKDIKDLKDGNAKLALLAADLEKATVTEANRAVLLAKKDEAADLQRQLEYNKAKVEAAITKSREKLIGPINYDIGKAISEFGRKNNYGAIYDASKLVEAQILLFVAADTDITKDFIAFYNARAAAVPIK